MLRKVLRKEAKAASSSESARAAAAAASPSSTHSSSSGGGGAAESPARSPPKGKTRRRPGLLLRALGFGKNADDEGGRMYPVSGDPDPDMLFSFMATRKQLTNVRKMEKEIFKMKNLVPFNVVLENPFSESAMRHACVFKSEDWTVTNLLGAGAYGVAIAVTHNDYELPLKSRYLSMKFQLSEPHITRAAKQELIVLEVLTWLVSNRGNKKVAITELWAPFVKLYDYAQCNIDLDHVLTFMRPRKLANPADADDIHKLNALIVKDAISKFILKDNERRSSATNWVLEHEPSLRRHILAGTTNKMDADILRDAIIRNYEAVYAHLFYTEHAGADDLYRMEPVRTRPWTVQVQEICDTSLGKLLDKDASIRELLFTDFEFFSAIFAQMILSLAQFNRAVRFTHWDLHFDNFLITKYGGSDVNNTYLSYNLGSTSQVWTIPLRSCRGYVLKLHDMGLAHVNTGGTTKTLGRPGAFPDDLNNWAYMAHSLYCPSYDITRIVCGFVIELLNFFTVDGALVTDVHEDIARTLSHCWLTPSLVMRKHALYPAHVSAEKTAAARTVAVFLNEIRDKTENSRDDDLTHEYLQNVARATRTADFIILPFVANDDIHPEDLIDDKAIEPFYDQPRDKTATIIDMSVSQNLDSEMARRIGVPNADMDWQTGAQLDEKEQQQQQRQSFVAHSPYVFAGYDTPLPEGRCTAVASVPKLRVNAVTEMTLNSELNAMHMHRFAHAFKMDTHHILANEPSPLSLLRARHAEVTA